MFLLSNINIKCLAMQCLLHCSSVYFPCGTWASGCESWCVVLSQWLWIMCAILNRTVVNHVVLYWADFVWVMVSYAEPLVVYHMSQWLWIMASYDYQVDVNHVCYAG